MDGKLIDACRLLLGPRAVTNGPSGLNGLDIAVIRSAYRRIAIDSHPDAARRPHAAAGSDGRRFIEASRAYEMLMGYLLSTGASHIGTKRTSGAGASARAGRGSGARANARAAKATGARTRPRGADGGTPKRHPMYYRGPVPGHPLRLSEFLYYSGRVSWQSLINSLVWQHRARPKFGVLARELRALSSHDVATVLKSQRKGEQTGETARRLSMLTEEQVAHILRLQRARHKVIGRYFVEHERMPVAELSRILRSLYRHNARFRTAA